MNWNRISHEARALRSSLRGGREGDLSENEIELSRRSAPLARSMRKRVDPQQDRMTVVRRRGY